MDRVEDRLSDWTEKGVLRERKTNLWVPME